MWYKAIIAQTVLRKSFFFFQISEMTDVYDA